MEVRGRIEGEEEGEIPMRRHSLCRVLSHYEGMSKLSNGKWLSTARSRYQHERSAAN